jgi:hypothetical protein
MMSVLSSQPVSLAPLERFARVFRDRVDGPMRKAAIGMVALAIFAVAHLARLGTPVARAASGAFLVLVLAAIGVKFWSDRRGWRDARKVVSRTIFPTNRDLGGRTLRAMNLCERATRDPSTGSQELAQAHLERTLGRVRLDDVTRHADQVARSLGVAALVAGLLGLVAVLLGPFRVIEGLDVLAARHGVAPMAFQWLDEVALIAHPPDYLHQTDISPFELSRVEVPYGSLMTVRGVALHPGRSLVLADGTSEIPFVDDAAGGVVARWPVSGDAKLRVAAKFGAVLIREPVSIEIVSIPDAAPVVTLEGAPKTVKLIDTPEIEVSYEASDDHGLREVHLVLRSGPREERRMLSRLDGETRHDRGGYRLWATDRFFKRAFAPVEVSVEARDNDPLKGPKWGKSAAITVIPPIVGEPEALRYRALEEARDALVDLAAFRIDNPIEAKTSPGALREHGSREGEETNRALEVLETKLSESYGGIGISRRIKTLARGQLRKMREALDAEVRGPTRARHAQGEKLVEDFALAVDGALHRLDVTDSVSIAKRLAEVADDAAEGAAQAVRSADREHGGARLEAGTHILDDGGKQLVHLGSLGKDLGEIVANDLKRAARTVARQDYLHTELVMRDLAARLRRPSPSFGGGRRGGVEAGGSEGPADEDGAEGGQQIAREQEQLEELSRDHAAEVSGVERAMSNAESGEELDRLREEARQHAQAVRDAVRSLPRSGGDPNSADEAAAAAREHAEAMAEELERANPSEAVRSGHSALGSLEQAERAPPARFSFRKDVREDARQAESKLDPEVKWAERTLERLRQAASARASDDLKRTSPRESKMADRARSLADEGSSGAGALPGSTLDLLSGAESAMREGSRALGAAEGDRALQSLKEAQRLLEMARSDESETGSDQESEGEKEGNRESNGVGNNAPNGPFAHRAPIPRAEDYRGPEDFRRRVLEGLGGAADPRLKDAVKRYAEGLLR